MHEKLLENYALLGNEKAYRIHQHLNKVMRMTFEGQALDIGWVTKNKFPDRNEYREMIGRKTGWYSGKGPCQCGALIANASEAELEIIGRFGEAIGIGFQVRDDLLNLTEESSTEAPTASTGGYGKERGGDIAEGKRTLITIEMMERLSKDSAEKLRQILLQPREKVTDEDVNWCIEQAESSGALQSAVKYCEKQALQAEEALNMLPKHPASDLLGELTNFLALKRTT